VLEAQEDLDAHKAPVTKISEWAKLMNSSTPYTIV